MGLFGSLFTGVSALFAQSQNTAMISNNIANVNTTGFKRSEASFNSLVTTESRSSRYSPGTVTTSRIQKVDQQGSLQQTASATDASISGNGFFPVRRSTDFGQEMLYTRAGQFSEDSQGLLRNASGFILHAWELDADGNLPANQGDLTSLVPADVAFLGGLTRPTTTAELAINLNADEEPYNLDVLTGTNTLPIGSNEAAHFSRGITVYDTLGSAQTITMEYRKIEGPMSNATSTASTLEFDTSLTDATLFPGNNIGDSFTVTVGGNSQQYTIGVAGPGTRIDTVGDLIGQLNTDFPDPNGAYAKLGPGGRLTIKAENLGDDITVTDDVGTAFFGGTGFGFPDTAAVGTETYTNDSDPTVPGSTFFTNEYPDQGDFPDLQNEANPNTEGWWELTIIHPDGSNITQGLMNFDGDGQLNAQRDAEGNIDLELAGVDWGNGSSPQDFKIDVERLSQFSGNYDVIFSDQNGAELGLRTGVEISREGKVIARFSNGASAELYQIPLVTFANANGLTEVSGTAYTENQESGEENLREAGTGGAGFIEPSTLEASNVDLADEFAKLIVAQRAFGAGTRTINTVDQMTQDLLSLR